MPAPDRDQYGRALDVEVRPLQYYFGDSYFPRTPEILTLETLFHLVRVANCNANTDTSRWGIELTIWPGGRFLDYLTGLDPATIVDQVIERFAPQVEYDREAILDFLWDIVGNYVSKWRAYVHDPDGVDILSLILSRGEQREQT